MAQFGKGYVIGKYMKNRFIREIKGVRQNLGNGLQLVLFKPIALKDFYISYDQLLLLVIVHIGLLFMGSYILSLPAPEFSIYGFATVATQLCFLGLGVYLFTKIPSYNSQALSLYILFLSIWPLFHLGWLLVGKSAFFSYWEFLGENKNSYLVFNAWVAAVVVKAISRAVDAKNKAVLLILVVYVAVIGVPLNYFVYGNFWHKAYSYDAQYEKYKSINEESTYYNQFQLIENVRARLLPQRTGVSDIYFVGFGGDANEDVFMKEVRYAKNVLDEMYDTQGRSIALINNIKTLEDTPLASKSNLALILKHIGELIDPEEDLLFLYLTSHGSKDQQLAVKFAPLSLNTIGPTDLKFALDDAGIKYRVLLVSACYSGGFIEPLKDDYTIVFTAAAKNKTSFGCGTESEFTYFGQAVFKENLPRDYDLIRAFSNAIESIRMREKAKNIKHSEPQLFIGRKIKEKILVLANEIEEYNREKGSYD